MQCKETLEEYYEENGEKLKEYYDKNKQHQSEYKKNCYKDLSEEK